MHTFALVNQKGGCGKTTSAVNLAGALAARPARVLLVDLDPQAAATLALGCAVEGEPSLSDVLIEGIPLRRTIRKGPGGISLVPTTSELAEFEESAATSLHPERVLLTALTEVAGEYDIAIIDCPPRADGVLTANALRAADTAVLVVECGAFALRGAIRALELLVGVASTMDVPFRARVLATLFGRTRLDRELLIAMQSRFGPDMFDTVIRTSVRLREAAAQGQPVQVLDPACQAALDFEFLADEVLRHVQATRSTTPGELNPGAQGRDREPGSILLPRTITAPASRRAPADPVVYRSSSTETPSL